MSDEPKQTLQPTLSTKDILNQVQRSSDPTSVFDRWPIHEVRVECLERLRRLGRVPTNYSHWHEWAQKTIEALSSQHSNELAKMLLEIYILGFRDDPDNREAIAPALGLALHIAEHRHEHGSPYQWTSMGMLMGLAARRIRRGGLETQRAYWLPCVQRLIDFSLHHSGHTPEAIQATRLIVDRPDINRLERLCTLHQIASYSQELLRDYGDADSRLDAAADRGRLQEAIAILEEARAEQQPDMNAALAGHLSDEIGLQGGVNVEIECPTIVSSTKPVSVRVSIKPSGPKQLERQVIRDAFRNLHVACECQGYARILPASGDEDDTYVVSRPLSPTSLSCTYRLQLEPGINPITLTVNYPEPNRRPLAQTVRYIELKEEKPA